MQRDLVMSVAGPGGALWSAKCIGRRFSGAAQVCQTPIPAVQPDVMKVAQGVLGSRPPQVPCAGTVPSRSLVWRIVDEGGRGCI